MTRSHDDRAADSLEIALAWEHEIERRVEEYERGEATTFAAEDVLAEARRLTR